MIFPAKALSCGDCVELPGFGSFTVKNRRPRIGCNPRTRIEVSVAEKYVPFFRTAKDMYLRLVS